MHVLYLVGNPMPEQRRAVNVDLQSTARQPELQGTRSTSRNTHKQQS